MDSFYFEQYFPNTVKNVSSFLLLFSFSFLFRMREQKRKIVYVWEKYQ